MCTFAPRISALKGVAPQLAAHKAGAVNMGNSQEVVDELCKFLSDNGLSQCDASADAQAGSWSKGNPNDAYAQYFTGQQSVLHRGYSVLIERGRQTNVLYLPSSLLAFP